MLHQRRTRGGKIQWFHHVSHSLAAPTLPSYDVVLCIVARMIANGPTPEPPP
jgi:hypothetical protein